jgi:hypothetical protein
MSQFGLITSVFGGINGAIGSYFQAQSQQYQLKSQAMTLRYQAEMDEINAGVAEFDAQAQLLAGQRAAGATTMKYGQIKGSARAAMAANGIQAGEGSAAEVIASTDLMKEIDTLTINANSVRAAEAIRMKKVNYQNSAMLSGVSADNALASAETVSPLSSGFSSLLNSAGTVANSWYRDRTLDALTRAYKS